MAESGLVRLVEGVHQRCEVLGEPLRQLGQPVNNLPNITLQVGNRLQLVIVHIITLLAVLGSLLLLQLLFGWLWLLWLCILHTALMLLLVCMVWWCLSPQRSLGLTQHIVHLLRRRGRREETVVQADGCPLRSGHMYLRLGTWNIGSLN